MAEGKTIVVHLARKAKKAGGDRYEYMAKGHLDFMALYFPQSISRPDGGDEPENNIVLKIDYGS